MEQVSCRSCGTCVAVEKFSPQHTSVQWNSAAVAACTGLARDGLRSHTCPALRASIENAVAAGELGVSTRDADVRTRGRTLR
ncbi:MULTISPECIES: hypothetical protein [Nocardia]|uniref:Ferredoxin n=1 Tax=Nocardia otitidiscaviarum TaxID=1823 RepID=A0A516NQC9_9NOCA|nr:MULTISPECIES: hypothetical protein [Nocardia]MBF6182862.1 hypothetical protein [Nocardia otitidiscaviarum]MCP9620216.1 hypothetical protein [Nocardia otitidiscaviarum]QDP81093.1 hypothetical protein FOH10_22605 [Nocardia otitidiscaviarum]